MNAYDVIAVGSGHNGLVAAAYLAVSGKRVLVLERQPWFGGGVVTRELTLPGFRHDQHSLVHALIQGNPLLLQDELGLKSRYGLRYLFPEAATSSIYEDGETLTMYRDRNRTRAGIARFSPKDAAAFERLSAKAATWLPMIASSFYSAPMPLGASIALLDQSREGRELWRTMQTSTHELLCQSFENDRVRTHFARIAGESMGSPDDKGTGIGIFVFLGFLERHGFGVPIGGSGALTDSLIRCIQDHGGNIESGVDVVRVKTRAGRANGVLTRDGREFEARDGIIAAIHPHLLGRMVEGIDSEIAADAAATEVSAYACVTVHAALAKPLRAFSGATLGSVTTELLPLRYDTLRRSFDNLRYGQLSDYPLVGLGSLSQFDASRAPAGKAILQAWDLVPYERADGQSWDNAKNSYAERMFAHIRKFLPNMIPENVLAYQCDSPLDMERTSSSFQRGDLHGIASPTYQSGAHRPTPALGQFTVPGIERLYLVGPFQHPGGGVFGAGRATAQKMCGELKIDFERARCRVK
jgi:phytoene dehydrogenase-like protein